MKPALKFGTTYRAMLNEAKKRRQKALQLYEESSWTFREIGQFFGVTHQRAQQMVALATKERGVVRKNI